MKVAILPIGQADVNALQFIQRGLKGAFLKSEVTVLDSVMPIPGEAYNSSRQQYRSTQILAKIPRYIRATQVQRVLGVTEADLYVPGLNFVFGEAQSPGEAALISLFRLKPEFYGESSNSELFLQRALKEAIHEVGHTVGLGHCQNPSCVMFFSNSIMDTDLKEAKFCEKCRKDVSKASAKLL